MAYEAAPIVEAVHFIQFADELSENDVRKVGRRLTTPKVRVDDRIDFNFRVENGRVSTDQKFNALMITSLDGEFALLLGKNSQSTSRRAPYSGWNSFELTAWDNYLEVKKSRVREGSTK